MEKTITENYILFEPGKELHLDDFLVYGFCTDTLSGLTNLAGNVDGNADELETLCFCFLTLLGVDDVQTSGGDIHLGTCSLIDAGGTEHTGKALIEYCWEIAKKRAPFFGKTFHLAHNPLPAGFIYKGIIIRKEFYDALWEIAQNCPTEEVIDMRQLEAYKDWMIDVYDDPGRAELYPFSAGVASC